MDKRKQVFSGIQPTGNVHFGRYFGAVRNWVALQEQYNCLYCVVDYHAITMPFSPQKLRQNSWQLVFNLLATGIKPENLFIQSMVPEHTELSWILNCFASYGQLTRMTQFKDKSAQIKEGSSDDFISAGLFDYPVLQAADILIYQTDYVPVGKDQEQHLEFSRDIAQRFNHQMGKEFFVLPEPLFTEVPKVMSTADPTRKMSASLGEKHSIDLFAEEARIRKQIASAVTDTGDLPAGEMSPGVANLFSLLKASGKEEAHESLLAGYGNGNLKYADLKQVVADALVEISCLMREKRNVITANKKEVKDRIKASAADIRRRARETVSAVKDLTGLISVRP